MPKITSAAFKSEAKTKAWTLYGQVKAMSQGAGHKKLALRRLDVKAWLRGLHHCETVWPLTNLLYPVVVRAAPC